MHILDRPDHGLVVVEVGAQKGLPVVGEHSETEPGVLPGKPLLHQGPLLPHGLHISVGQGAYSPLLYLLLQLLQLLRQPDPRHQLPLAVVHGVVVPGGILPAAVGHRAEAEHRPHPEDPRPEGGGQQDQHRTHLGGGIALQPFHPPAPFSIL